jgi:ABC-type lipopolysaccharide export system ATPase subunit
VLSTAAAAMAVMPIAGADDPQRARSQVHALLADLDEQQQLNQHGVLLSSIDRLSVEIATAVACEPGLESDFDLTGAGID